MTHKISKGMTGLHHTDATKLKIGLANKGKSHKGINKGQTPWNKNIVGYSCIHKKIQEINWQNIVNQIKNTTLSSKDIIKTNNLNITEPTIIKYIKQKDSDTYIKLMKNGKIQKSIKNPIYINGQHGTKTRLRNKIKLGLEKCTMCGDNNNLHIHHKKKQLYDKDWQVATKDLNYNNDNITILCASCHLKEHYKLGRKSRGV